MEDDQGRRAPQRLTWRRRASDDAGAGSIEYVGVVVVVGVVVGVLLAASGATGSTLAATLQQAVCSATGGTDCGSGGAGQTPVLADGADGDQPGNPSGPPDGSDADRRDTARDARDSRRDDRGGEEPETGPDPAVPGNEDYQGLGDPVAGESVPMPSAPPWAPVDDGAGAHGSEDPGAGNHATKFAAEVGANAMAGTWPNASRNLLHFLGNTGQPLQQDVDALLADVPALAAQVDREQQLFGLLAVERAQAAGATGPVTFPVSGAWTGFYVDKGMSADWFYAMGGITYSVVGQVTVYPPSEPGGSWTYETTTALEVRDQYNWDGGKSTQIGPFNVTDEQLAELHRAGLAQEFTATGRSSVVTTKGTA